MIIHLLSRKHRKRIWRYNGDIVTISCCRRSRFRLILPLTPNMEPYQLTATQTLDKFKDGSLKVEGYARSLLARIEKRDANVHAWAHLDPDYVIQQAKELDSVPPEKRGPLHGIAIAVKDVIYTKKMPTQHNSPIYEGDDPQVDAASIITLRHAGALILGKTTTTEFASTTIGPKTRNPHDTTRTPGGSSSGSAAAVGDFQAPIGLGTQTGGSTIRPGSYNGIYAFKPTWNAISREGQKIYSLILDTIGFFARSIDDFQLLANVFDIEDDTLPPADFSVKGSKFALIKTVVWPQAGPGMVAALAAGAKLLREHGAEVEEIELPPEFDKLPEWHRVVLFSDGRPTFLPEYRIAKDKLSPFLADHVENSTKISRAAQLEAFDGIASLRPKIDEIASKYTAILTPSVVDEAPVGMATGSPAFNSMWTALHTPVTNIPGFKGENGLPVGLSLVAPRYHDRRLLAISKAVGEIFEGEGGWKRQVYS
ncbi:amidase [Jackrogersella minutella]|nr:amidase [Jackrogersella minutella]